MKDKKTNKKLTREILLFLAISAATALFFLVFSRKVANSLVYRYADKMEMSLNEMQQLDIHFMINNVSLIAAVLLFVSLFLFLLGQKLAYLQVITEGIQALRVHRMDYVIPLEGENELTDLARSINELSETERHLAEKEKELQQEREHFIRALSHDIRTPLTSILSYTEYMAGKEEISKEEWKEYFDLMLRKSEQMKQLTNQLLDSSRHNPEWMEQGKFLMEQLVMEWEESLEQRFMCQTDFSACPDFSAHLDVGEFRRIFDNLYSNVEKYADVDSPVELKVGRKEGRLFLCQKNKKAAGPKPAESHQLGIPSIKNIARNYGGTVKVIEDEDAYEIQITLLEIHS